MLFVSKSCQNTLESVKKRCEKPGGRWAAARRRAAAALGGGGGAPGDTCGISVARRRPPPSRFGGHVSTTIFPPQPLRTSVIRRAAITNRRKPRQNQRPRSQSETLKFKESAKFSTWKGKHSQTCKFPTFQRFDSYTLALRFCGVFAGSLWPRAELWTSWAER